MQKSTKELGRKLTPYETDEIFNNFAKHPMQKPHIEDVLHKNREDFFPFISSQIYLS